MDFSNSLCFYSHFVSHNCTCSPSVSYFSAAQRHTQIQALSFSHTHTHAQSRGWDVHNLPLWLIANNTSVEQNIIPRERNFIPFLKSSHSLVGIIWILLKGQSYRLVTSSLPEWALGSCHVKSLLSLNNNGNVEQQ